MLHGGFAPNILLDLPRYKSAMHYLDVSNITEENPWRFVSGARTWEQREKINVEALFTSVGVYHRTLKEVKAGEEFILDYGFNYWTVAPFRSMNDTATAGGANRRGS